MPQNTSSQQTSTHDLPVQMRVAQLVPSTFDDAANTVEVVWTEGARVRRYDWWNDTPYEEELVVEPGAVDMTRFDAGTVQVLDGHRTYGGVNSILGVAERGWIDAGQGRAVLRLSQRDDVAGIVTDIKAGIIRSISFGYSVERYEITRTQDRTDGVNMPLYRATKWTPQEISFVTVPADPGASTRSAPSAGDGQQRAAVTGQPCVFVRAAAHQPQEPSMPSPADTTTGSTAAAISNDAAQVARQNPAPGAPAVAQANDAVLVQADVATRSADILELCERHSLGNLASGMLRRGIDLDAARAEILNAMATRSDNGGGERNVRVESVGSEHETRMAGIAEAIESRINPAVNLTDNGRQYRGMSLIEIGREMLERGGVNTRGMSRMELAGRMLQLRTGMQGTGDFAALLGNVAGRRLRAAYEQAPSTYQDWARRAPNAPDFKEITVVQLSGAPELLRTNEHGEFTYGTLSDGAETYKVVTHGRIVSLTRQAIVNDDLRGFDRLLQAFGDSARRLENRLVYSQISGNPKMADGKTLFHADHGNLGTGAGSALAGIDALKAGRKAMRKQVGLQGEVLNIAPGFLIVPAELEQMAYQLTSSNYVPAQAADVNEFRQGGRTALTPVIEPLLDGVSESAWYLASSSGSVDTVEYCYLDGAEGPVIETQQGWEVDGVSVKARLDFAAKAVDSRGLYKGAGA